MNTQTQDRIPEVITLDRSKVCEIVSRMLNEPGDGGIYRTTRAYNELEALIAEARAQAIGYAWGAACTHLDQGVDPRSVEVPGILEAAVEALNPNCPSASEHP